ncbi:MAG: hypothetical protein R3D58_04155 [Saprospiraceae bacterium]
MFKTNYLPLFLLCLPTFVPAQETAMKTDTIIYEKHGKPRHLYPQWTVSQRPDTFDVHLLSYRVEQGDTLGFEKQDATFLFAVEQKTTDSVWLSFYVNADLYAGAVNAKDCPVVAPGSDYVRFRYRMPVHGGEADLFLLNCAELQARFVPLFQQSIACQREKLEPGDRFSSVFLERMEANIHECATITGTIKTLLAHFLQWHGMLAPKRGALRYQVRMSREDANFDQYMQVQQQTLPNGNKRYEIQEDTSKAAPAEVRMMRSVGRMENFFKAKKEKPILEASDVTTIELNALQQMVRMDRLRRSRMARNGTDKQTYFEYSIRRR